MTDEQYITDDRPPGRGRVAGNILVALFVVFVFWACGLAAGLGFLR